MWIAIGIVGGLALIIAIILSLPVYVIAKTDDNDELMLRYRFLHMEFGEEPDPENPILLFAKEATGLAKTDSKALKSSVKQSGVVATVKDTCNILLSLLGQVAWIVKYCTLTKLELRVVCASDEAGDAAVNYGKCCAAIYPAVTTIHGIMNVRPRGEKIDVLCDFFTEESRVTYDIKLRVSVLCVLQAFLKIVFKEAMRMSEKELAAQRTAKPTTRRTKAKKSRAVTATREGK